jgi:hypothetical protein
VVILWVCILLSWGSVRSVVGCHCIFYYVLCWTSRDHLGAPFKPFQGVYLKYRGYLVLPFCPVFFVCLTFKNHRIPCILYKICLFKYSRFKVIIVTSFSLLGDVFWPCDCVGFCACLRVCALVVGLALLAAFRAHGASSAAVVEYGLCAIANLCLDAAIRPLLAEAGVCPGGCFFQRVGP